MKIKIRMLIIELLKSQSIVESWGISSIDISNDSVSFDVIGFQFQGNVTLEYVSNRYSIKLNNKVVSSAVLKDVVKTLDTLIEVGDMYYGDIMNWVNKQL